MSAINATVKLKGEYRIEVFGENGDKKIDTGFLTIF